MKRANEIRQRREIEVDNLCRMMCSPGCPRGEGGNSPAKTVAKSIDTEDDVFTNDELVSRRRRRYYV